MKKTEIHLEIKSENDRIKVIQILRSNDEKIFKKSILNQRFYICFVLSYSIDVGWLNELIPNEFITIEKFEKFLTRTQTKVRCFDLTRTWVPIKGDTNFVHGMTRTFNNRISVQYGRERVRGGGLSWLFGVHLWFGG